VSDMFDSGREAHQRDHAAIIQADSI